MSTISSSRYPKPISWDEFERISLSAFGLRWDNPNLTRHGRQGQAQQGVDIYGKDNLERLVGVQCKNTINSISEALVDVEVKNAESFKPQLSSLFIATTADSDAPLQSYVRDLSNKRHRDEKFTVDIIFWDSIIHDLSKDPNEVAKHFPQFFAAPVVQKPEDIQRGRDIKTLTDLLNYIDIDTTQHYLRHAPKYINMKFMEHIDCFRPIINSQLFTLYDQELTNHLNRWLGKWQDIGALAHSAPYNYINHSDMLSFHMPGDFCQTIEDDQKYESINQAVEEFFSLQMEFCNFIRSHYFEIDLRNTSASARKFHAQI